MSWFSQNRGHGFSLSSNMVFLLIPSRFVVELIVFSCWVYCWIRIMEHIVFVTNYSFLTIFCKQIDFNCSENITKYTIKTGW